MKKIVIIGPESTGKSTLSEQLAAHFNTLWCAEYAREYLLCHGKEYNFATLLDIAKGQLALEEKYAAEVEKKFYPDAGLFSAPLLFIDTDMYVMKVWCEYVFGKCHHYILEKIAERKYDLYLLCDTDLPWTKDELREYPDEQPRKELYNMYKDILVNQQVPWINISGDYQHRFKTALNAVLKIL
ncbi:AAA family ATPase [Foetidibacter luteolus]|uniref:AAA family ATPase n=1 Tax=Foetidibacter luteolus TaxID=2608880 RepID=UPI00129BA99D|nr:ATP-binding protein [Foetidibacter luteolus]